MNESIRLALFLAVPCALSSAAVAQSSFAGYDSGTGEIIEARTEAAPATLELLGAAGVPVDALDYDAAGRHLWAVSTDQGVTSTGRIHPETGQFEVRSSSSTMPALSDITSSPDGFEWYGIRTVGADVELYSGDLPHGRMDLLATFAAVGRMDTLAVDRDGTLFGIEATRGELVRLDPATAFDTAFGTADRGECPACISRPLSAGGRRRC